MASELPEKLDAIRAAGVETSRVLLIGGAAANPGVQAIAGQVFDLPVHVPAPGEYVADGAARQAAWVLTGQRPAWPVDIVGSPAPDHRPEILRAYHRVAGRY